MSVSAFRARLRTAALDRQADLFTRADAIDARARKEGFETAKRARLGAEARALRDEATRIGDRYYELAALE